MEKANEFLLGGLQLSKDIFVLDQIENDLEPQEWIQKCQQKNRKCDGYSPIYINNK